MTQHGYIYSIARQRGRCHEIPEPVTGFACARINCVNFRRPASVWSPLHPALPSIWARLARYRPEPTQLPVHHVWQLWRQNLAFFNPAFGAQPHRQECGACGARTGPQGREGLAVRAWACSFCGTQHQRDVNSATVIRNRGLAWLEKECSIPGEARADEAGVSKGALRAPAAGQGHPAVGIPVL